MAQIFSNGAKSLVAPTAPEDIARKAEVDAAAMKEFALVPDYTNMESTNRITANNGTWTVDRTGYVQVSIQATAGGSVCCEINGKRVGQAFGSQQDILVDVFAVNVGDVVKLFVDTGTPINLNCQYIPPKVAAMSVTPSLANSLVTMGPPDYSKQETTNRITANNGTWTVDRNGYVHIHIQAVGPYSALASINDKKVGQVYSGTGTGSQAFLRDVYSVKVGDVVKLFIDGDIATNIGCYYIPPVVNPPLYVEGQPLLNYSTAEQDTGTKGLDGSAIWQRTFTGNITAEANVDKYTTLKSSGVQAHLKSEGWIQNGHNSDRLPVDLSVESYASSFVYQGGGGIHILSKSTAARTGTTNNAYRVTVWYTKTS